MATNVAQASSRPSTELSSDEQKAFYEDQGYLVRRVTAEDVLFRPRYVLQRIRRAIAIAPSLALIASTSWRHCWKVWLFSTHAINCSPQEKWNS